ncbi:MAG: glycosyl hydrolase family 28 protein [Verrucomicrobiota bacterium JB024]|nr:glycosyl hydrolase family 28 protein [Verrucomicrobiota bacterium JB024]
MQTILKYGAIGDGKTLNTTAIQAAIDAVAESGGGTLLVPPGHYVTGTLVLKNNLTLRLEPGAVIVGSSNPDDYPPTTFHHHLFGYVNCLLYAFDGENIRLTGDGVIDFNHEAFMDFTRPYPGRNATFDGMNERQIGEAPVTPGKRPRLPLFFHHCKHVRVDGLRLINSPCWTVTASCCQDVKIESLTIDNNLLAPNNDCVHICGSQDVVIRGCVFSAADDCIAVTGITDSSFVADRIVISDCTMRARSSAIRLGHFDGKVQNVVISNITAYECNRGLSIFSGDGGWVENVRATNLVMQTQIYAGGWWGKGEPAVICAIGESARIANICLSNIEARSENSITLIGQAGNVRDISLIDWRLRLRAGWNRPVYGSTLDLAPFNEVQIEVENGETTRIPWLHAREVNGLYMRNVRAEIEPEETAELDISPIQLDVTLRED